MNALVQSVWTVIAMVVFIGIVIWAYSSRRKTDFEEASRMPSDDDKPENSPDRTSATGKPRHEA